MSDQDSTQIRIHKFIAESTNISRRKAELLISAGRVSLNGKVLTTLGAKIDPLKDRVSVDGKLIKVAAKGALILHKPIGCITSRHDPEGRPTVYDLLSKKFQNYISVGRLDYNTSGLLIFTNDGDLANHLMHPSHNFERVYRLLVRGALPESKLELLQKGIKLNDGMAKANGEILGQKGANTFLELRLTEGRNRIVRRIMDHLGFPVIELKRIKFGPFNLGRLPYGEYEVLENQAYLKFRQKVLSDS